MLSLAQLLGLHPRALVLDASSTRVAVGLLTRDGPAVWHTETADAGNGLFAGARQALHEAQLEIADVDVFVACVGPGSQLGQRTVQMAIGTWTALKPRPVFAYRSLALAARAEWTRSPRDFSVIADARRDSWHVKTVTAAGTLLPLERSSTSSLPPRELLTPHGFRAWSAPPPRVTECSYDIEILWERSADFPLLDAAEPWERSESPAATYVRWAPRVHSGQSPTSS